MPKERPVSLITTAISPSGHRIATSTHTHLQRIGIRDAKGRLHSTLIHRAAPMTEDDSNSNSHNSRLLFFDDNHLATIGTDEIVVHDIRRGVVAYTVPSGVVCCCCSGSGNNNNESTFFVASNNNNKHHKARVLEYSVTTGRLLRKLKVGRKTHPTTALAVVGETAMIVATASDTRVWDRTTATKGPKVALQNVHSIDGSSSGSSSSRTVAAVTTQEATSLVRVATGEILSCAVALPPSVAVVPAGGNAPTAAAAGRIWMLTKHNVLYLLEYNSDDVDDTACRVVTKCQVQLDDSEQDAVLLLTSAPSPSLLCLDAQTYAVQTTMLDENLPETLSMTLSSSSAATNTKEASLSTAKQSKKRKDVATASATTLGPAQAGDTAKVTDGGARNKRSKKDDDDDDDKEGPTVAERLALLQKAFDDDDTDSDDNDSNIDNDTNHKSSTTKFFPKKATTESLTQLLTQALASGDVSLLELALQVRDVTLLSTTCRTLDPTAVHQLLTALTVRLHSGKAARAEHLCVWMTALLPYVVHNTTTSTTNGGHGGGEQLQYLMPLRNLIQERADVFPMLLTLEGRLQRLVQQGAMTSPSNA